MYSPHAAVPAGISFRCLGLPWNSLLCMVQGGICGRHPWSLSCFLGVHEWDVWSGCPWGQAWATVSLGSGGDGRLATAAWEDLVNPSRWHCFQARATLTPGDHVVLAGTLWPGEPKPPAPETPKRSNCSSYTHHAHPHTYPLTQSLTHTLSLTPVMPVAMLEFLRIFELILSAYLDNYASCKCFLTGDILVTSKKCLSNQVSSACFGLAYTTPVVFWTLLHKW